MMSPVQRGKNQVPVTLKIDTTALGEGLVQLIDKLEDRRGAHALIGEVLLSETQRALEACLAKLAPKVRDLLWRRYSRRQSSTEMAEAAGMTSNAVRVTLSKARVALRDCISSQIHSAQ